MTNLEYLVKLKKDNFREFVVEDGNYREHMEGRKVIALEIIAETLITIDRNIEYLTIPKIKRTKPEIHFMTKGGKLND